MALDYFYDQQLRRYLLQFVRIFSGFQYAVGNDSAGRPMFRTVPATLASMDRQVNSIMQNNSENVLLSAPQISCSIVTLRKAADRIQDPNFVRTTNVFEREFNPATRQYVENNLGKTYTVESYMPVPYDLVVHMDLWTSNEFQKHQLIEQILVLFNPSIDLQTGTNPIDWSSLTIVELEDITWSSRSYPAGTTDQIDVTTLAFKIPIWLNAPAKVKRQNIIHQIVIDIGELQTKNEDNGEGMYWSQSDLIARLIVTPGDHYINVIGNEITLLSRTVESNGEDTLSWVNLLQKYGKFRNNISQIRLKMSGNNIEDSTRDIVGTIELNPNDPSKMFWTLDMQSLPANTLFPLTRIIDPSAIYPGKGLDPAAVGQRYLLLHNISQGAAWGGTAMWHNVLPDEQDVIEYTSTGWIIVFDASNHPREEYVLNSMSGKQLHWNGNSWHMSIEGEYSPGYWRLYL